MENFSLLEAAARSGRPILLKRGMMATVADLLRSAQVILDNGNPNVILCERGIRTFETAMRNTFDVAAIALLKHISHLAGDRRSESRGGPSRPGAGIGAHCSCCRRGWSCSSRCIPIPDKAWSDGEQSLDFADFDEMMASLEPYIALRSMLHAESCRGAANGGCWMRVWSDCTAAAWRCCCRFAPSHRIRHRKSAQT